MNTTTTRPRPKHLDLTKIKLPIPGIISIMHRVSGAVLFLVLPFLLCLLQSSLQSPDSYVQFRAVFDNPLAKLVLIGLLWAFLHHFCAGIRYLALDMHMGTALPAARTSIYAVLGVSMVLTVIFGVWLW